MESRIYNNDSIIIFDSISGQKDGHLGINYRDFPRGSVARNPPAGAEDIGLTPQSRKIPHAMEHLSPGITTTKVGTPGAVPHEKRSRFNEKTTRSLHTTVKSSPHLPQPEKAHM